MSAWGEHASKLRQRYGRTVRWVVAFFAILGGALPMLGLFIGGRRVVVEHRRLADALDKIDRIINDDTIPDQEKSALQLRILKPAFNWGRVTYTYEWIRREILGNALADLRGPALVAATGVLCGAVASVWSLWLPPI